MWQSAGKPGGDAASLAEKRGLSLFSGCFLDVRFEAASLVDDLRIDDE
jgi:hypothetical protein